jgi:membrane-bound lytic murein transglycosylase B
LPSYLWHAFISALVVLSHSARATECNIDPSGFDAWKASFTTQARANGIGPTGIAALKAATYSMGTILADRGQKSFRLALPEFLAKRGAAAIVAKGRRLKGANADLFASISQRFGVPPGPLLAIWGMETGFGTFMGNQNTLSAVATLTYDCRRPDYFAEHLYAALKIDRRRSLSSGHDRSHAWRGGPHPVPSQEHPPLWR